MVVSERRDCAPRGSNEPRRALTLMFAAAAARPPGPGVEALEPRQLLAAGPVGSEFRVNSTTENSQASPAVAMDADGTFVVAWASGAQDGSDSGVYAQRYNAAGVPVGGEF